MAEEELQHTEENHAPRSDYSIAFETKALAEELGIVVPEESFKENPHFWYTVYVLSIQQIPEVRSVFMEGEIPFSILLGDKYLPQFERMIQIEALRVAMEIIRSGYIDSLTKAWNREGLEDRISFFQNLIKEKSLEEEHTLILYFIDLDHFKKINDTLGHSTGDIVLQNLVEVMRGMTRPQDSIFRYGGEEFCLVQFMSIESLKEAADKLDMGIDDFVKHLANKFKEKVINEMAERLKNFDLNLTLSMGVARIDHDQPKAAIARTDALMYVAKRTGRDRVVSEADQELLDQVFKDEKIKAEVYTMLKNAISSAMKGNKD